MTGRHTVLGVVPARMSASRLPGKPLLLLGDRPVVRWVYDAAVASEVFDLVVVATDSPEIRDALAGDVEVVMTRSDHKTGTDRVAEVAAGRDADVIVNVQGDQPFVTSHMLEAVVGALRDGKGADMSTIACPLTSWEQWASPDAVKVVTDLAGNALYFSRSPVPHGATALAHAQHHLGLYAFRRQLLLDYPSLRPGPLEAAERLEQLRVLENGRTIAVASVDQPMIEINTPEDLVQARAHIGEPA